MRSELVTIEGGVSGGVPEWLKGTDCKSVGLAYVGSNPTPSTNLRDQMSELGDQEIGVRSGRPYLISDL
jgi:hypothetical protein